MIRDYVDIGPVPANENCEQLGKNYRKAIAMAESRAFIKQILRQFTDKPASADVVVKHNPHDFGTYLSVVVEFDDVDGQDWAMKVEDQVSPEWDEEAKVELKQAGVL